MISLHWELGFSISQSSVGCLSFPLALGHQNVCVETPRAVGRGEEHPPVGAAGSRRLCSSQGGQSLAEHQQCPQRGGGDIWRGYLEAIALSNQASGAQTHQPEGD